MGVVKARYMNGDVVDLHDCETVNDVRVCISRKHGRVASDIYLFDVKFTELGRNMMSPSEVIAIIQLESAWTHYEEAAYAIWSHVAAGDDYGAEQAIERLKQQDVFDASQRRTICGLALLDYIACSARDSERRRENVVGFLSASSNVNTARDDGETALYISVKRGYHAIARLLCQHKDIDVNCATSPWGVTPLLLAALNGDAVSVRILLDYGADVDEGDLEGHTPLNSIGLARWNRGDINSVIDEIRHMLTAHA